MPIGKEFPKNHKVIRQYSSGNQSFKFSQNKKQKLKKLLQDSNNIVSGDALALLYLKFIDDTVP
ncbi:MAG TPA: hypothetical protein VER14_03760, partial [Phototrophicaceae bacterium]|nr:hypothetical protein [Phototrophicaceae bacterium]